MSVSSRLKNILDQNHVKYSYIAHSPAYTAHEAAAKLHTSGHRVAKAVILTAPGGRKIMAVLPGDRRIDMRLLTQIVPAADWRLATEGEFRGDFPDCEVGAMPPFGNLYGLRTLCDESLAESSEIIFNAGTHAEALRMSFADYERVADPELASFSKGEI